MFGELFKWVVPARRALKGVAATCKPAAWQDWGDADTPSPDLLCPCLPLALPHHSSTLLDQVHPFTLACPSHVVPPSLSPPCPSCQPSKRPPLLPCPSFVTLTDPSPVSLLSTRYTRP